MRAENCEVSSSFTYSVSSGTPVRVDDAESGTPQSYVFHHNYPNPFKPSTQLFYNLPRPNWIKLEIFNIAGQRLAKLVDEFQQAGEYAYTWNAANATDSRSVSGVYFARLRT